MKSPLINQIGVNLSIYWFWCWVWLQNEAVLITTAQSPFMLFDSDGRARVHHR